MLPHPGVHDIHEFADDGFVEDVTALYKKGQFVAARVLSLHEDDNDCCISLRVGVSVSDDV